MADPDISAFVAMVGATEPTPGDELYSSFRRMFKRHNYFLLKGRLLIVKISRSKRPFWGLGKELLDFVNELDNYALALLVLPREGWVFSKADVNANIRARKWRLSESDNNYKINPPLPERNMFAGKARFYEKLGISEL